MAKRDPLDPTREALAVKSLRESIGALDGDDQLLSDTIEGETGLFELIDALLVRMDENGAMAAGLAAVIEGHEVRRARFLKRVDADRALIEQAFMIAEIETVERPGATLFLSRRAPKVEISTEADIPAEFWKAADPTLDRKALLAALKEGRAIPGAALSNSAPSLSVRTK